MSEELAATGDVRGGRGMMGDVGWSVDRDDLT
jgi:hypothetical protein